MADDQTEVVKQPANSATWTRLAAVGATAGGGPQVIQPVVDFFATIAHNLSPMIIPMLSSNAEWSIASLICAAPAMWAAWSIRGTTVAKDLS